MTDEELAQRRFEWRWNLMSAEEQTKLAAEIDEAYEEFKAFENYVENGDPRENFFHFCVTMVYLGLLVVGVILFHYCAR